jgi:hypothetical protein
MKIVFPQLKNIFMATLLWKLKIVDTESFDTLGKGMAHVLLS